MKKLGVAFYVVLILGVGSCATLLKGKTDQITVISEPSGAKVSVNGDEKGTTPVSFDVPSKEDLNVHIAKDGYQAQDLNNPAKTRWGWETFSFFSYVIPVFVDMGTGAAWGHDELTMTTHLEPASQTTSTASSGSASPPAESSPAAEASTVASAPSAVAEPSTGISPSPAAQPSPVAMASIAAAASPNASTTPAALIAPGKQ